jgi:hypothetical protein
VPAQQPPEHLKKRALKFTLWFWKGALFGSNSWNAVFFQEWNFGW